MKTESKEYEEYLEGKFLPGRPQYLEWVVYPRYLKELVSGSPQEIWDLGFGMGEFLSACRKRNISARGIDSNPHFVDRARKLGLTASVDDLTTLTTLPDRSVRAALSDNVLEHLKHEDVLKFFRALKMKLAPGGVFLAIVPGEKGFTQDPTHQTFVDEALIAEACRSSGLSLAHTFRWPLNSRLVSRFFYLNMTVFKITL